MTPPPDAWKKDEWEPEWLTEDNIDPTIVTTATSDSILLHPQVTVPIDPTSMDFPAQASSDSTRTRGRPSPRPDGYPSSLPWPPYPYGAPAPTTDSWETLVSTPAFAVTPYPETQNTVLVSTTDSFTETDTGAPSPSPLGPYRGRPSDWDGFKKDTNHTPMYAIATVVPIVLLAIIAAVTLVCLRRRKRRRAEAAAQAATQEMKMEWHDSTERAPMGPPPSPPPPPPPVLSVSQHYTASQDHLPPTSTPSQFQPIILGPISPSSNGAYLTGIDTSDMVSINSGPPTAVDPFSDNHSLTEPPPPYRPSSIAPPSFTSNSRQSSLRVPVSPICSHGAERSPFDDPDDAVSILSDLSFQRERFTGTYSSR